MKNMADFPSTILTKQNAKANFDSRRETYQSLSTFWVSPTSLLVRSVLLVMEWKDCAWCCEEWRTLAATATLFPGLVGQFPS